jgi:hypothetical protein
VLVAGVHAFVAGRPFIEGTRNKLSFTIPGEMLPREVTAKPAEVVYGADFEVFGANLKGGRTQLMLTHRDFPDPLAVDASWNVRTNGTTLTATARASVGAQAVLPGIYGVMVRIVVRSKLPDGSARDFDAYSNQETLAIAPSIVNVTFAGGVGTITVDGFRPHLLPPNDLLVLAGSDKLARTTTNPPPAGTFLTPAAPPAATFTIRFRLPAGTVTGTIVPIRIVVRNAESPPRWEVAP